MQEGNVKLGDSGLATKGGAGTELQECCGTEISNAPELVLRKGYDGRKADTWSLGIVLYFIHHGAPPLRRKC